MHITNFVFGMLRKFWSMLFVLLLLSTANLFSQEIPKEKRKALKEAQTLVSDAGVSLQKEAFVEAEADYRKAIALAPENEAAKYNLGNAYYDRNLNGEANRRYKQSAAVGTSKNSKHMAFHNLGNTYMNDKKYQDAVDAYKNALRNNPTDDETRYNLALAKKMLENEQKEGGGDEDDKEQNKQNEDNKENKDKKDDSGENDNDDEGDKKEDEDKGDEKEDKSEGDKEKDQGKPDEQKEGEQEQKQQQQPVPGQLSPQQVKNLLEAMNNQEKKVQDKINAKKQKGAKVKSNKDW